MEPEVVRANAIVGRIASASPIHGSFRQTGTTEPFPLILCGLHCTACDLQVGGAMDLSGEVGPTDGPSAAKQLVGALADRGCSHAAETLARFESFLGE